MNEEHQEDMDISESIFTTLLFIFPIMLIFLPRIMIATYEPSPEDFTTAEIISEIRPIEKANMNNVDITLENGQSFVGYIPKNMLAKEGEKWSVFKNQMQGIYVLKEKIVDKNDQ